jgi:hypothetical protein
MSELNGWESFYVIIGGAAGALIGLQFVVLTLVAERPSLRSEEGGAAFSTPVVVHFATALFIAALMSVPWQSPHLPRLILGAVGLAGIVYGGVIVRHMLAQKAYTPVLIDWISNVAVPVLAYGILVASAIEAHAYDHEAFFGVAAVSLLLMFVGVYNSWDAISYHALSKRSPPQRS